MLYLPAQRVLAAGDLLEDALPWVDENTHPVGWARTLDALAELDIGAILPAHGAVHGNTGVLERQRAFFRYIVDHVVEAHERGEDLERIKSSIDVAAVPTPVPEGHPSLEDGWPEYVVRVVERTYRELTEGGE